MNPISSRADYTDRDRRFARYRQDSLYVPLEPSPPVFKGYGSHFAAGIGMVLLMCCAFPFAQWLVELMARVIP